MTPLDAGRLVQDMSPTFSLAEPMSDTNREKWDALAEIFVHLQRDDVGYPPKEWEQLKAERTASPHEYKVRSVPFFARGLAYDDLVTTKTSSEGYDPVVDSVVERGGYSTMRLVISESEDTGQLVSELTHHGCLVELDGNLVAIGIPSEPLDLVSGYLCAGKESGRWDAEDGFIFESP